MEDSDDAFHKKISLIDIYITKFCIFSWYPFWVNKHMNFTEIL